MENDQYRQKSGDMSRDLEEKESSRNVFDSGAPDPVTAHQDQGHRNEDKEEAHREETTSEDAHFVDASDDPNLRISRRTSELTEPERGLAAEMDAIRHDDSRVVARPMGPFDEEGADIEPINDSEEQS